jgi:hypothetical protein
VDDTFERTEAELAEQLSRVAKERAFLPFEFNDLVVCAPWPVAALYAKPEMQANWVPQSRKRGDVIARMAEYMPFAWQKANDCRGLSAMRSMMHFRAWTWLAGDDLPDALFEDYGFYGKDVLVRLCELYGWDHRQWDDGRRVNTESE